MAPRLGVLWRRMRFCQLDIQVFKLYRMNKIMAWYQICKQYGVVKDMRRHVLPLLEEEFCTGSAGKYSPYLSPLQSFELFQSSQLEPETVRQILHVSHLTFEERRTWVLVCGPVFFVCMVFLIRCICNLFTQTIQLIPTFLP